MKLSDFSALLQEELSRRLPAGAEVRVTGSPDGRRFAEIFAPADLLFPSVPLGSYCRDHENGRPLSGIAEEILRLYGAGTMHPVCVPSDFENKKAFCAGLRLFPLPERAGRRPSHSLPLHSFCGLKYLYTVRAQGGLACLGDAFVTEDLLRYFRVGANELFPAALRNMSSNDPALIFPLRDYPGRLLSDDPGEKRLPVRAPAARRDRLYVLTNGSCLYGASAILYPGIAETLLRRFGPYYLLPSSVHELLVLPREDAGSVPELQTLIRKNNNALPDPMLVFSDLLLACGTDGILYPCP